MNPQTHLAVANVPSTPPTTITGALVVGYRELQPWQYGGEQIIVKGRVFVRAPKEAHSKTEWARRGFLVRADAKPHCERSFAKCQTGTGRGEDGRRCNYQPVGGGESAPPHPASDPACLPTPSTLETQIKEWLREPSIVGPGTALAKTIGELNVQFYDWITHSVVPPTKTMFLGADGRLYQAEVTCEVQIIPADEDALADAIRVGAGVRERRGADQRSRCGRR